MQEAMEFRLTWARNRGEFRQASPIAAAPLQDLDLVAVGVLNEEEARHQCAVALKLLDLTGLQPHERKPHAFRTAIVHAYGQMAIAITMPIGLCAPCLE
jgi:hypothetical protein